MKHLWVLLLVLTVVAQVGASPGTPTPSPAAAPHALGRLTISKVAIGMGLSDVLKVLGPCSDTLGTPEATYQLTYDRGAGGHDPMIIFQQRKAAFIEGETLENDGHLLLKVGATRTEAEAVLGAPDESPQGGSSSSGGRTYKFFELVFKKLGDLHVITIQAGKSEQEIVQYFNIGNRDI